MFQFLSRNSVRWDHCVNAASLSSEFVVSIPQSEFCPLGQHSISESPPGGSGFNSSVGILSVGTQSAPTENSLYQGFNSSVGILSVGTYNKTFVADLYKCFNSSVGILSVGTSVSRGITSLEKRVSIPQSEFCPLGHGEGVVPMNDIKFVSIPQSEFCPLGRLPLLLQTQVLHTFQFLSRNSVRWDEDKYEN